VFNIFDDSSAVSLVMALLENSNKRKRKKSAMQWALEPLGQWYELPAHPGSPSLTYSATKEGGGEGKEKKGKEKKRVLRRFADAPASVDGIPLGVVGRRGEKGEGRRGGEKEEEKEGWPERPLAVH